MSPSRPLNFSPVTSLLIGASLWGVIWYPMRLLEARGLGGLWLTLLLFAAALAASLPRTARALPELTRQPGLVLLLMATAGWTNIAFVEAVLGGNILRVLLLFYLSPLWATLFGWLWLHERITGVAILSLAIAMAGALIMLWNPALGVPWPESQADWMALSSGFAFALSNVATRKAQDISVEAKVVAVWSGVCVLAVTMLALMSVPTPDFTAGNLAGAAMLGIFGILLMTFLVQYGVTHMPVHRSAVISLIELVAGAVSQQLLTNEIVHVREWVGGALIVAGAWLATHATPNDTGK